jgi:hypothetical protein
MNDPERKLDPVGSTEGVFKGQAAKGGPVCDPFDFHSEPHLRIFPQCYACEAFGAMCCTFFLVRSGPLTVCLLGHDERKPGDEDGKHYKVPFWRLILPWSSFSLLCQPNTLYYSSI